MKNVGSMKRNAERTSAVATAGSMSKAIADTGIIPKRMLTTSIAGNGGKIMIILDYKILLFIALIVLVGRMRRVDPKNDKVDMKEKKDEP